MEKRQQHALRWDPNGVPVSLMFDDPFYSLSDGLAETRHVFLDGNDLPARLRPGFHVAELGVGTGLNLAALLSVAGDLPILYTGFEAFPLSPEEARRALAAFPDAAPHAETVARLLASDGEEVAAGNARLRLIRGDARDTLPGWDGSADAWFLDGFAPARNPELWGEALMTEVARHTAPGGTFATYTAAGHVRRALAAAGFEVSRVKGYGTKRHMSRGVLR